MTGAIDPMIRLHSWLSAHGWTLDDEQGARLRGRDGVIAVYRRTEGRSRYVVVYRDDRNELDVRAPREHEQTVMESR